MLQSRDEAGSPDSLWVMDITPLVPQLITAVATLGGVVLTLLITGRRERERVDQMIAFEREKILADDRRFAPAFPLPQPCALEAFSPASK